jgi:hypothetical protein
MHERRYWNEAEIFIHPLIYMVNRSPCASLWIIDAAGRILQKINVKELRNTIHAAFRSESIFNAVLRHFYMPKASFAQ